MVVHGEFIAIVIIVIWLLAVRISEDRFRLCISDGLIDSRFRGYYFWWSYFGCFGENRWGQVVVPWVRFD